MKIWISDEKGNDKIIAYHDGTIYRGNPDKDEMDNAVRSLQMLDIPVKNFTPIPLHYMKLINMDEGENYIEVLFGRDSSEHLRIKDADKRKEIFEFFKANIPHTGFFTDHYSKVRAGKKPLIAMLVVAAIFGWTYYIATGIENGIEYGVTGDHKNSLAGIVLALAYLGSGNLIWIFGTLFSIALISFILKNRKPKIVHRIQVRS